MAGRADRLVKQMQRRLYVVEAAGCSNHPEPHEIAELEARVDRLRALDRRFNHVGLSVFVAGRATAGVPGRVGGACVATEV